MRETSLCWRSFSIAGLSKSLNSTMWNTVHAFSNVEYRACLTALGLFSVRGRLLRADLTKVWKVLFHGLSPTNPSEVSLPWQHLRDYYRHLSNKLHEYYHFYQEEFSKCLHTTHFPQYFKHTSYHCSVIPFTVVYWLVWSIKPVEIILIRILVTTFP